MNETLARSSNNPEGIPDLHEARELIREAVMAKTRNMPPAELTVKAQAAKDEAARSLLREILELHGTCGIKIEERTKDLLEMSLFQGTANICNSKGTVQVQPWGPDGTQTIDVPLDLDPETNRLIGIEKDRFRTPVPGVPIGRRPAVAVVVEVAMKALSGNPYP